MGKSIARGLGAFRHGKNGKENFVAVWVQSGLGCGLKGLKLQVLGVENRKHRKSGRLGGSQYSRKQKA